MYDLRIFYLPTQYQLLFISGWVIVAVIMAFFSFMIALFPKELPDRAVRKLLEDQTKDEVTKKKEEVEAQISWKGMQVPTRMPYDTHMYWGKWSLPPHFTNIRYFILF